MQINFLAIVLAATAASLVSGAPTADASARDVATIANGVANGASADGTSAGSAGTTADNSAAVGGSSGADATSIDSIATGASAADEADSATAGVYRRDISGSLDAIHSKLANLQAEIDSTIGGAISGWQGGAKQETQQALQKVDSALREADQVVEQLAQAFGQACSTYQSCEGSIPF